MLVKVPSYYKKFRCIAGRCSDTCCDGWKISIDEETVKKYKGHKGELKGRFEKSLICKGKDAYFLLQGSRCPFLNDENECDIYIKMGKEALSSTCASFPRRITVKGGRMQACLSMSCPEAAGMLLKEKDGIKYQSYDDGAVYPEKLDNADVFINLVGDAFINVIKNRDISLKKRIIMIIFAADSIRRGYDNSFEECVELIEGLNAGTGIKELEDLVSGAAGVENLEVRKQMLSDIMDIYASLCSSRNHHSLSIELTDDYAGGVYNDIVSADGVEQYVYQYENYIEYFIFRHMQECVDSDDIFNMAVMMCVSYAVINAMDKMCIKKYGELSMENQVEIMHYYSKIIEHSKKDYDMMLEGIKRFGYDKISYMVVLI